MHRHIALLALATTLCVAGCGQKQTQQTSTTTPASITPPPATTHGPIANLKVALLTTGPVTDGGWNESAYDGLLKIQKDEGATIDKQENLTESQFEEAMRGFANQGYNIIFAHGDEFSSAAARVAKDYPNTLFVTTGGDNNGPNLVAIHFATEEGTYLQGMEAAFVSKTGKGGFIGGQELPPVKIAADAFANGAKSVNPQFQFQTAYIGNWNDALKAKAQTETFLSNGADVIAHNCDAAAAGMFQAVDGQRDVYAFGVNADENKKASNVLSSAILDIPKSFDDIAAKVKAGTFVAGPLSLGMKDNDVRLVDNPALSTVLSAAERQKIADAAMAIKDGKIKVVN